MGRFIQITHPGELTGFIETAQVPMISAEELAHHAPDAHWLLSGDGGELLARCSLWWRAVAGYRNKRLGYIGHYAASDMERGKELLRLAGAELARNGCNLAVGPLDGSTWRRYRFVTGRGSEPPFFLEPDNPDDYPLHFETAGFTPMARFFSSINPDLEQSVSLPEEQEKRLRDAGITLRTLDPQDFDGELARIFDLSVTGFRDNFLYTPIDRDEFLTMYGKVRAYTKPELVLFAQCEDEPVGFIFALPDMLRLQRGEPLDTVILKSMAVLPQWNGKGIGALLMARVTENARQSGFRRAIHALMHENNRSRDMSRHYGPEIRQYTLFCREIA